MRTHTLLTRAASIAVCFGIVLSTTGTAFAGERTGLARDVQLSAESTFYGQVVNSQGRPVDNATVELRYQGQPIARTATSANGQFAVTGVRPGAHELVVGNVNSPIRLWKEGTAPSGAAEGLLIAADESIVRGQQYDGYGYQVPGATSGFGLIDVVTLTMLGTSTTAMILAIHNHDELNEIEGLLISP
ncbi:MAG: carboxypeptidase regulatory-like domain-containing protein [Planctomycetaceae bacterium]|nr:carboxypeptidase regulatory-like domain-containing protein [Planctomycetaceae bacterium]